MLRTVEELFFAVKGVCHPPERYIASLKYVPSPKGSRKLGQVRYKRVESLSESFHLVRKFFPHYLVKDYVYGRSMQEVPFDRVKRVYNPVKALKEIVKKPGGKLELLCSQFALKISRGANVPLPALGVSGSILLGLHRESSDIDLVVYGRENSWKVYRFLKEELKSKKCITPLPKGFLAKRCVKRFKPLIGRLGLKRLLSMELRRANEGLFNGKPFFVRFVPNPREVDEKYGDRIYRPVGRVKVTGVVEDDAESIMTPCRYVFSKSYVLEGPKVGVKQVLSFRGRFIGLARQGERVICEGRLEKVYDLKLGEKYYVVVLEGKSDYMLPKVN